MLKQCLSAVIKSNVLSKSISKTAMALFITFSASLVALTFSSVAASSDLKSHSQHQRQKQSQSQTLLIGGDLRLCTSLTPKNCNSDIEFSTSTYSGPLFELSTTNLNAIQDSLSTFPQYQSASLSAVISQLQPSNWKQHRNSLSARDIRVGLLRSVPDAMQNITTGQWQFVLDHLESEVVEKRFLQRARSKRVEVSLEHTSDDFSVKALRQISERSKGEKVLVITAGNSDVFADVEWVLEALEQLDLEPTWLPIDAALVKASMPSNSQPPLKDEQRKAQCETIPSVRAEVLGRFNRHALYPSLNKQMQEHCEEPEESLALIDEAHVVLLWGDNPHTLAQALMRSPEQASQYWQRIKARHRAGELLLVANGGVVPSLTAANGKNAAVIDGESHESMLYGYDYIEYLSPAYPNPYTLNRMLKTADNSATLATLDVFDDIMFDTQFSNKGNQGRLMSLSTLARPNFSIGIDSRTTLFIQQGKSGSQFFVEGEGGVAVFDNRNMAINTLVPVQFGQVVMSYLTEGDMMNISNNDISFDFADWKFSSSHYGQSVVQSGQVFSSDNFFKTMYMLCSTGGRTATLKHVELGKGHQINVKKQTRAASVNGSRNVNGKNYRYCSFRGYELETKVKV